MSPPAANKTKAPAAAPTATHAVTRKGPDLVGDAHKMRDLVTSKPLVDTFKDTNASGYLRIVGSFLAACVKKPDLYLCDKLSVIDAVCKAVAYNLETDGVMGRAYLLPRWSSAKGCNEMNFQLGYKGIAEFFYRANAGGIIDAGYACEQDTFTYSMGTTFEVELRKARGDRGPITHFYGFYRLANGNTVGEVWTVEEMGTFADDYRADKGKSRDAQNKGLWSVSFDQMGVKTMVLRVCKRAPLSAQGSEALTQDEYLASGKFQIGENGIEPTPEEPLPEKETPKDGEPSRRMSLGANKSSTPQGGGGASEESAGSVDTSKAAGSPPLPPSSDFDIEAEAALAKKTENERKAAELKAHADAMAAKVTPEGRAAAAKAANNPGKLVNPLKGDTTELLDEPVDVDLSGEEEQPQDAAADPSHWLTMSPAEVWETWQMMSKGDRTAAWNEMTPEEKVAINASAEKHGPKKPAPGEAADPLAQKAAAYFAAMPSKDAVVKWVMGNRLNMKDANTRGQFAVTAGLDPAVLLNENPPEKILAYAVKLFVWLEKNNVALVANGSAPVVPGRPAAKRA